MDNIVAVETDNESNDSPDPMYVTMLKAAEASMSSLR